MKIALYIEDGLEQVVLTPETKHEKTLLAMLHDGSRRFEIKRGSFYPCQGGWVRRGVPDTENPMIMRHPIEESDDSTMIVLRQKEGQRES